MKRTITILGSLLLITALAVPAFSWGPRGGGGNVKGNWRNDNYGPRPYNRGYAELTDEQRTKLAELDKKFFDETNKTRNDIWAKSAELGTVLNTDNPDVAKAKELQKEISNLKANLDEKRMEYDLEVRKIVPDSRYTGVYGPGMGYNIRDYGRNMGMGFGPGSCWR